MFQSLHRDVANLYIKCCIFESLWCNIGVVVYQPPLPGVISRKVRGHVVCVGGGGGGMIRGWSFCFFVGVRILIGRLRRRPEVGVPPDVRALAHPIQNCVTYSRKEDAHVWW
jgi:hypothetical protein